jgi:hypothetical protein
MRHRSQQGSALVYILIAVILFAAVVVTFTRGQDTASIQMDQRTARVTATEILSYAQNVKSTVDKLISNGCSETEISFENTIDATYTFVTRNECKVFQRTGGKLRWQNFPNNASTAPLGFTGGRYNRYNFSGTSALTELDGTTDIGTAESDLAFVIGVNPATCEALNLALKGEKNRSFGGLDTDQNMVSGTTSFVGTFASTGPDLVNNYCVRGTDFGVYSLSLITR